MRQSKSFAQPRRVLQAAVFVDYDDLHRSVDRGTPGGEYPDELVAELLKNVLAAVTKDYRCSICRCISYGDYSAFGSDGIHIQKSLHLQGVETRLVVRSDDNSAELRLGLDLCTMLYEDRPIDLFVVVTGSRSVLPIVRLVQRAGRHIVVVPVEPPDIGMFRDSDVGDVFVPVSSLVETSSDYGAMNSDGDTEEARKEPVAHESIEDRDERYTLELIEQHFGHYDVVYLTPLLRKLSEVFSDDAADPKTLVNRLEQSGAVWLEKRRGFPYDYTVLILDESHPDVLAIRDSAGAGDEVDDELMQDERPGSSTVRPHAEVTTDRYMNPDDDSRSFAREGAAVSN